MTRWTDDMLDDRLDGLLAEVGDALDFGEPTFDEEALRERFADSPAVSPVDSPVLAPARRTAGLGWRVAAAVIAVVVAGSVLAVTPAREAIADWFGIGNTQIVPDPPVSEAASGPFDSADAADEPIDTAEDPPRNDNNLGDEALELDRSEAVEVLGRPIPEIPGREVRAIGSPPEGGVLILFADDDLTLWVRPDAPDEAPVTKQGLGSGSIDPVDDLGDDAYLLSGEHVLVTPGRTLRAGTVVLWVADGLELRLEGDLADDEMIALARAVRVPPR